MKINECTMQPKKKNPVITSIDAAEAFARLNHS
jgi:hypothetical protein